MTLPPGARLGPYQVIAPLGAGGMGEVYKAHDTRLGRDVAVKVLRGEFASDLDRRRRFEAESRAVAALNHPHICVLHDIGSSTSPHATDGSSVEYLVMELLSGPSLAERLANGPLPMAEALLTGADIAEALAAAHRQGIVHRDLKPSNIKLTKTGPKLLDFGLAKLRPPVGADGPRPPVPPADAAPPTAPLSMLGTLPYMAPEQLEGKPADARTDVFAFGAVLYEMLTGGRAFGGESDASVISAIMTSDPPPVSSVVPVALPALDRLVHRCLAKLPDERWQDAADLAHELRWLAEARPSAEAPRPVVPWWRRGRWLVACAGGAVAVLLGVLAARSARSPAGGGASLIHRGVTRGVIELPPSSPLALGLQPDVGAHQRLIAVSPDGRRIAFVGPAPGGSTQIYLRDLSSLDVRPVADTVGALHPFFSPDGRWLGFLTIDKVKKVPLGGGPSIPLCDARTPQWAEWTPTGTIFVGDVEGGLLSRVSEAGGRMVPILPRGEFVSHVFRDGRFALVSGRAPSVSQDYAPVEVVSLDTLARKALPISGYQAQVLSSGYLVFVCKGTLMVAPFDLDHWTLEAVPVPVAGVESDSAVGWAQFAVADSGLLVYAPGGDHAIGRVVGVDRTGRVQDVGMPERHYGPLALDTTGTRLAIQVADLTDSIWIYDMARREGHRVPIDGSAGWPAWSPDGGSVAVSLSGRPDEGVYRVPVSGGGAAERLLGVARPESWSPDGHLLAFSRLRTEGRGGVVEVSGGHAVVPLPPYEQYAFSPDSRSLAYLSYEFGTGQVWVRALADASSARQVSTDGGFEPFWTRDALYFRKGRQWFAARVTSLQPRVTLGPARLVFETDFHDTAGVSYAVSPDGQRLYVVKSVTEPQVSKLVFVENWTEELPRN